MIKQPKIAAVVLTHNSTSDLPDCLTGLALQTGIDLTTIVVDNLSTPDERVAMEGIFQRHFPNGRVADAKTIEAAQGDAVFVRNDRNAGYSTGNNIGARVAAQMGCASVLIINPDVRINDAGYLAKLNGLLHADEMTAVASSAIVNVTGAHENPMPELSYVEELLWPFHLITKGRFLIKPRLILASSPPFAVEKVSGSCFMIRTDFLDQIGFFDENVFLYCEEAILMMQAKSAGWSMMLDPGISAVHAHHTLSKGDPVARFRALIKSRAYFHKEYSGHSRFRQACLRISHRLGLAVVQLRFAVQRARQP